MNEWVLALGWMGIFAPVALGSIGSVIGCALAGQAAIGAMMQTDSGYGRFIGLSVLPSSFVIYGIVLMFTLQRPVVADNSGGLFGIGVLAGVALLMTGLWQGRACASAINASKEKPEIFALTIAPAAIVEGFGVFVFIFALVLSGGLGGAA
ncbi:V-type ATP synthase subunit K [Bacterioplanes sanyensis]|uniref:V-type ATP synthase subunit K n=1 Tax=Bacterioplanes sanyensis TaxID=1249553 RepID=A0A222FDX9_9GAMM|nr:ATP synthase subunit C [Bacterioplanes sanyensis]ASP37297.1 V-type ATP synthase subunit K [Bacterioplanes sanyensis]